jgi:hypothetical protein
MTFATFWAALEALEKTIAITTPAALTVKRAYWGAPPTVPDMPCCINALSEPERVLGFGGREQTMRVTIQLIAARATVEDTQSALIATALWFAMKDKFDKATSIGGTVAWSTLRGGEPTVPVILEHAGQAYIGVSAVLDIRDVEAFTF